MCLAAIYWARIGRIFYAGARRDAAAAGFDDDLICREIALPVSRRKIPMRQLLRGEALKVFKEWRDKPDKVCY
jgi:tRNA(Arg) A34 adenosine deaminase TadA